jgi:hypothetical protein
MGIARFTTARILTSASGGKVKYQMRKACSQNGAEARGFNAKARKRKIQLLALCFGILVPLPTSSRSEKLRELASSLCYGSESSYSP